MSDDSQILDPETVEKDRGIAYMLGQKDEKDRIRKGIEKMIGHEHTLDWNSAMQQVLTTLDNKS